MTVPPQQPRWNPLPLTSHLQTKHTNRPYKRGRRISALHRGKLRSSVQVRLLLLAPLPPPGGLSLCGALVLHESVSV